MGIDNLVEKINEDVSAAVTTSGNPAVDYLPGGFTHMRNMLNTLSVVKKQWNIDVLENELNYNVKIEDALDISIAKKDYKEFNTKVIKVADCKTIDLNYTINEARTETVHKLYSRLNRLLTANFRANPQVRKTLISMNYWLSLFSNSRYLPMTDSTAIQLNNFDNDVRKLMQRIKNLYADDVGGLEMLSSALQEKRPLSAYEPFSEYDYVTGARVQSEYDKIIMILELTVSNSMIATQSLYIESADVLEELKNYKSVKILKNIVFPVGEVFNTSIFNNIKEIIDGLEGK